MYPLQLLTLQASRRLTEQVGLDFGPCPPVLLIDFRLMARCLTRIRLFRLFLGCSLEEIALLILTELVSEACTFYSRFFLLPMESRFRWLNTVGFREHDPLHVLLLWLPSFSRLYGRIWFDSLWSLEWSVVGRFVIREEGFWYVRFLPSAILSLVNFSRLTIWVHLKALGQLKLSYDAQKSSWGMPTSLFCTASQIELVVLHPLSDAD